MTARDECDDDDEETEDEAFDDDHEELRSIEGVDEREREKETHDRQNEQTSNATSVSWTTTLGESSAYVRARVADSIAQSARESHRIVLEIKKRANERSALVFSGVKMSSTAVETETETETETTSLDASDASTLDDMNAVLTSSAITPSGFALHLSPNSASERTEREQIDFQRGSCAGCGENLNVGSSFARRLIEGAFRPFRGYQRCDYTNEVYCDNCSPATSFAIIPWRVLAHWDFRPRRVCSAAATFLHEIDSRACLRPGDVNPALYTAHPELGHLRDARVRINAAYDALRAVAPHAAEKFKAAAGARSAHFFADPELFSLRELRDLHRAPSDFQKRARALEHHLRSLVSTASSRLARHASPRPRDADAGPPSVSSPM